jgi:alpha-glucosidase (family GH31 glycosyl hydrolase)
MPPPPHRYTWDNDLFPDPQGFLDWAHGAGLTVGLNLHPGGGVNRWESSFAAVATALGVDLDARYIP